MKNNNFQGNEYIVKGVTSIGFKYALDLRKASDIKVINLLIRMNKADGVEAEALGLEYAELILGKPQYTALETFIRKKNEGYCPLDIFGSQVSEIINGSNKLKN